MGCTINEGLNLLKMARLRKNSLEQLRGEVSTKQRFYGQAERTVEPQYDVIAVDAELVKIDKLIFKLDTAIKQANAVNTIEITEDTDIIFKPLTRVTVT